MDEGELTLRIFALRITKPRYCVFPVRQTLNRSRQKGGRNSPPLRLSPKAANLKLYCLMIEFSYKQAQLSGISISFYLTVTMMAQNAFMRNFLLFRQKGYSSIGGKIERQAMAPSCVSAFKAEWTSCHRKED
mmetsp:Transcript_2457/g.4251  ORF Transcript_2457/g.4251 Transcript_2457/m.4251 type:complete len:132 (-) Transcript_2457:161-556(-)